MSIIQGIKNIFALSTNGDSISFYKLYNKLRTWEGTKTFPQNYELPGAISFPEDFWRRIIKLYKYTRSDEMERAISVFWADGDLILTSDIKGNRLSVTPKSNVRVAYKHTHKRDYLRKTVYVNDKKYLQTDVYYKKVPKKIEVKYLFNMHTHPPHYEGDNKYYGYFSKQDIVSLLKSNAVITGLVTDKLHILIRTKDTPSMLGEEITDRNITPEFLTDVLHLQVYSGEFKHKLVRFFSELSKDNTAV